MAVFMEFRRKSSQRAGDESPRTVDPIRLWEEEFGRFSVTFGGMKIFNAMEQSNVPE